MSGTNHYSWPVLVLLLDKTFVPETLARHIALAGAVLACRRVEEQVPEDQDTGDEPAVAACIVEGWALDSRQRRSAVPGSRSATKPLSEGSGRNRPEAVSAGVVAACSTWRKKTLSVSCPGAEASSEEASKRRSWSGSVPAGERRRKCLRRRHRVGSCWSGDLAGRRGSRP